MRQSTTGAVPHSVQADLNCREALAKLLGRRWRVRKQLALPDRQTHVAAKKPSALEQGGERSASAQEDATAKASADTYRHHAKKCVKPFGEKWNEL